MTASESRTIIEKAADAYRQSEDLREPSPKLTENQKHNVENICKQFLLILGTEPEEPAQVLTASRFTANGLIIEFKHEIGVGVGKLEFSVIRHCPACGAELSEKMIEDSRDPLVRLGETLYKLREKLRGHKAQCSSAPKFEDQVLAYMEITKGWLEFIAERMPGKKVPPPPERFR